MDSGDHRRRLLTEDGPKASLPYRGEIWRKALHLLSLSIPVGLMLWGRPTALSIILPLAVAFVAMEIFRCRSEKIRDLIYKGFGFMMRPEEIPPVPSSIRFNGATWVLLSASLVIALFEPRIAASAVVIGLIGDAAAALVGRLYGRHPIGRMGKSLEGSIAFALTSFAAVMLVPGSHAGSAAAAVIVATIVEGVGTPINDNLSVPLAAAIVLTFV